jgi:hypothetical protein
MIAITFHYDFSTSCVHCHLTTLWVKHNQIVTQHIVIFISFSWEYAFSEFLTLITYFQTTCLSLMRNICPSMKKQGICQWLSIRLLLSQHTIVVIIATYQKESLTEKKNDEKLLLRHNLWLEQPNEKKP